MKRHKITALLMAAMLSTMTACGNKAETTMVETMESATATEAAVAREAETTTEVAVQDNKNQAAALPMTDEVKPVVAATSSPDAKTTDAPKTTTDPKATAKPVVTATAKPETQVSNPAATAKPNATETPKSTDAPKNTAAPTTAPTAAPMATATPVVTAAPEATATPAPTAMPTDTPAPTAATTACQHTNYHIENAHDSYQVRITGECYEQWRTATRVCNDCGYNFGEAPDRVGDIHHGCIVTEGVSATCTTDGRTAVESCDCGGRGEVGGVFIPALGHDYVDECTGEISEDLMTVKYHSICRNCGDIASEWWE